MLIAFLVSVTTFAQFHTMNIPQSSPKVHESQRVGITDITINYNSPALRGRDVWNNSNIIPQEGDPYAWRAGANMNTTIEFSTDVMIEGQTLKAGLYGFHIIPKNDTYTLLFAHNNHQWGSYYLDIDKDVTLKVTVNPETCTKSEQLDYEFLNRTENSVIVGLEWGEKRIPFKVEVDLNKTVVESFRSELRGLNTYRWQAWNDAANWCLNHDTNLEEALEWVNRSINGGLNGFAANKNVTNVGTKMRLLKRLNRTKELQETVVDAKSMIVNEHDANSLNIFFLLNGMYQDALEYSKQSLKKYPESWSILLNKGIANYFLKNKKAAVKDVKKVIGMAPERFENRLNEIIKEFETDTYKLR
jgi:tetratricopeptide (TPR) repeat protein